MKKRGRPEYANDPRLRRWLCLLFVTVQQQQHQRYHIAWAIFPPRQNTCRNDGAGRRARLNNILQKIRAGAINWDEPYYSDYSDAADEGTFLPNEEEEQEAVEEEDAYEEQQPRKGAQYESDEDEFQAGESDADLPVAPFLESFEREVHSIVHDYRREVSETFQHLKDDILDRRTRYSRPSRSARLDSYVDEGMQQDDMKEQAKTLKGRRRKAAEEKDSDDDLIVGDTDDDDDRVIFRLNDRQSELPEDTWNDVVWDDDQETDALTDTFWAEIEEPRKKVKKRRKKRRTSKKKESDSPLHGTKESGLDSTAAPEGMGDLPAEEITESGSAEGGASDTVSVSTAAGAIGSSSSLSNTQIWKSVSAAVSVLAMAILLNLAYRILSKVLWAGPTK